MVEQWSPPTDTFRRPIVTVATVALWLLAVAAAVALGVLGGHRDSAPSQDVKPTPITITEESP